MNRKENNIEMLSDLIKINNDRIAGYRKALNEADIADEDLLVLCSRMINESKEYVDELFVQVKSLGENSTAENIGTTEGTMKLTLIIKPGKDPA